MKKIVKHFKSICIIILIFFIFKASSCDEDEKYIPPDDPKKAILGKWETVEIGNWPNMEPILKPIGYKEYLADSVLREYSYETETYFYKRYWIDSLLHESTKRDDEFQLIFEYHYIFYNNKLRLDYSNILATYNTFILKRIN